MRDRRGYGGRRSLVDQLFQNRHQRPTQYIAVKFHPTRRNIMRIESRSYIKYMKNVRKYVECGPLFWREWREWYEWCDTPASQ